MHSSSYSSMSVSDTSKGAQEVIDRRYASMSVAEKVERLRDLTRAVNQMALAGLRLRHPTANERELLLELAKLRLGNDLVDRVYGKRWRRMTPGASLAGIATGT